MSVWVAIALAVTGSACMNVGLVLQKRGITALMTPLRQAPFFLVDQLGGNFSLAQPAAPM